ncbi:MAG TPA: hypothetical protein HA306_08270 [Methanosarcina sp.]|nr:hypothetical protein [Methanosarcina sp.]
MAVGATLAGMTRNALAADTFDPSLERGYSNLMSLQYADKAQWILDSTYALIDLAAKLALIYLVIRILLGGWDDLQAEIKGRRAFTLIIVIILGMKIGLMLINLILSW